MIIKLTTIIGLATILTLASFSAASAASATTGSATAKNTTLLNNIITRGTNEINRRLTTLNALDFKISASTKISSSYKTALTAEVNNENGGLTTLKSTLSACTTVSCAESAAQSIFTEYRVYALVAPQIEIVKTADDQQLTDTKLDQIATHLSSRVGFSSSFQADLNSLNNDVSAAQNLSSSVESAVEALTPSDYNSDHGLLVQYYGDLKQAQTDNQSAYAEAHTVISSLTSS